MLGFLCGAIVKVGWSDVAKNQHVVHAQCYESLLVYVLQMTWLVYKVDDMVLQNGTNLGEQAQRLCDALTGPSARVASMEPWTIPHANQLYTLACTLSMHV